MPLLRSQVVFTHASGLPRDSVVNTFHFHAADTSGAVLDQIHTALKNFYNNTHAPQTGPLAGLFSNSIPQNGHRIKTYSINEATGDGTPYKGAPPLRDEVWNLSVAPTAVGYPSEVALCLSYRNNDGTRPTGGGEFNAPPARRRGRIYFGPIGSNNGTVVAGVLRPDNGMMGRLLAAGDYLRDLDAPAWVIYSRPYEGRTAIERPGRTTLPAIPARLGTLFNVQDVWVDNSFDTVRRRGERATARTVSLAP